MRTGLVRAASALLLLAGPLVPSGTAAGTPEGLGVRLLEAPADRRDDPRASVYIVDHTRPGASFIRQMEVVNDTGTAQEVSVYPVASEIVDGSFGPLPGRTPNDLTTWMSVEPQRLSLEPGGRAPVAVTIDVPDDAPEGEHYAAVMAETAPAVDASGVAVNTRVGIRTYLSVGPGGEPASDFSIESLTAARDERGRPVVQATVTNTGGRALDMSGSLSLSAGPGGLSAGPFPAELGTTLGIGESSPVTVVLDPALPTGPWKARIDLRSGLVERAAEATLSFPAAAGQAGPRVPAQPVPLAQDPGVVVPAAVGVLSLVTALLAAQLLRRYRARRRAPGAPTTDAFVPDPRRSADQVVRS